MAKNELKNKQLELDSLIEFSQLIGSNLDLEFILGNILLSIMGKMMIPKGMIILREQNLEAEIYRISAFKGVNSELKDQIVEFNTPKTPVFSSNEILNKENCLFYDYEFEFYFKIYFTNKLLGILCLGNKFDKSILTNSEIIFIETLLNISAPSIENTLKFNEIKVLNKNLNSQLQQLKSLFEISKEFNTSFQDRNKIIKLLKYTLLGNFGIKDFLILSNYNSDSFFVIEQSRDFGLGNLLFYELSMFKEPTIISSDNESYLLNLLKEKDFRLLFPIKNKDKVETIVCLGSKLNKSEYTKEDIQFLESILNLTTISIDNTMLFNEYLEKQKIEDELNIAREIQIALLPSKIPVNDNYQFSAVNIPALQIGGDYYDIIKLKNNKFAIVIADVSGKGTPASLLMANIQSAVHSFLKLYDENDFDISLVTSKINELIYENTSSEKFITFFWGILDTKKNIFEYVNCGHNPPLLFNGTSFSLLDKGGLMLGVLNDDVLFESGIVNLKKNDMITFYTDGVTEANNSKKEEYGEDKLKVVIKNSFNNSTDSILKEITESIYSFSKNVKQYDDITLIVLKKTS
jgi:phosphoserine phosphatase RsbU/P